MQSLQDMLLDSSIDGVSCGAGSQSLGGVDDPEAFGTTPDGPTHAQRSTGDFAGATSGTAEDAGVPGGISSPVRGRDIAGTQHVGNASLSDGGVFSINNLSGSDGDVPMSHATVRGAGRGGIASLPAGPSGTAGRVAPRGPPSLAAAGSGAAAARGRGVPRQPASRTVNRLLDVAGSGEAAARGRGAPRKPPSRTVAGSGAAASRGGGAPRKPAPREAKGAAVATRGGGVARKPSSLAAARLGAVAAGGGAVALRGRASRRGASRVAKKPAPEDRSSSSMLSDDGTENDEVRSSDGNMNLSDGNMGSIIGSIDGEGSVTSDSSYVPRSTRSSLGSDQMPYAFANGEETGVSCHGEGDAAACFDKPGGMMLAKEDPSDPDGDFLCSKIWQKYTTTVGDTPVELFQVVFKDGSKAEYRGEEVLQYQANYMANEGARGCDEFFFMV